MNYTDIEYTVKIRVRYADTDQMGVANNGMYFTWFEVGRTEFLRVTGLTYKDVESKGFMLPLRETGVKYLKPARYDDVISIRTTVAEQKGVRLRFSYEATRGDDIIATGFTEHVFTDVNMKPVKPPKELADIRSFLKEHGFLHNTDEVLA